MDHLLPLFQQHSSSWPMSSSSGEAERLLQRGKMAVMKKGQMQVKYAHAGKCRAQTVVSCVADRRLTGTA